MNSKQPPELTEDERQTAMLLGIVVRNAMESFHTKHLSDSEMRELNPIIRNAIATGLHALAHCQEFSASLAYLNYHASHIPSYWESPELLDGYISGWAGAASMDDAGV